MSQQAHAKSAHRGDGPVPNRMRSIALALLLHAPLCAGQDVVPPANPGSVPEAFSPDGQGTATVAAQPPAVERAGGEAAKDKPPPRIGEIIVTARRTAESLQDVPMSINVMSAEAIIEKGIINANDLAQASPGLSAFNGFTRQEVTFSIRGQGQIGSSPPGVLPYYAEVPDFSPFFYDLASVQVLKGPQGTLFGRNTTGGAILFTPNKPSDHFSGFIQGRLGNHARSDLDFAVGGPILTDRVTLRIAGQVLRQDGYTRNLGGEDLDDTRRESFRATLSLRPVEGLSNDTIFQHDRIDETGSGSLISGFNDDIQTPNQLELRMYVPLQDERGPRKVNHDFPDITKSRKWGVINTTAWSIPGAEDFTLKNIYRFSKGGLRTSSIDADGSPYHNIHIRYRELPAAYQKNDELQLQYDGGGDLKAVGGLYYEYLHEGPNLQDVMLATPGSLGTPQTLGFLFTTVPVSESAAAFLQGTWAFRENWDVTVGARYTKDKRETDQGLRVYVDFLPPVTTAPVTHYALTSNAVSWNVALDHAFTDDLKGYATVRRGYKAGGFVPGTITSGNPLIPGEAQSQERVRFEPEYVTDYELGIKSLWRVGAVRLRANVDAFFDDYTDIQRLITLGLPEDAPSNAVTNASKAKIAGADVDLLVAPTDYFDTAVQYTYLWTKYDRFDDPSLGDLSKTEFPNTPQHQVGITPTLRFDLPGAWGKMALQAPFFYQSRFAITVNNVENGNPTNDRAVPGSNKPGFTRWDLRVDWREILSHPFSLALYVRNLTDAKYEIGGIAQTGQSVIGVDTSIYAPPRMVSLELRYEWE